jgi:hypothetical protein
MIELRIGKKWARLLVDTGASSHVLSLDFLREALGADPQGERLNVSGLLGTAQPALLLPNLEGLTREAVALRLLEPVVMPYDGDGDDGLLAPQLLSLSGVVELDLPRGTLTLNPGPAPALKELDATRCEPFDNLSVLYVAEAVVDGLAAPLLVDTGASYSALDAQSPLGKVLAPKSAPAGRVRGLGESAPSRRVLARVAFSGRTFPTELRLVDGRATGCEAEGHLGMDLLHDCRLRFGPSWLSASCARREK